MLYSVKDFMDNSGELVVETFNIYEVLMLNAVINKKRIANYSLDSSLFGYENNKLIETDWKDDYIIVDVADLNIYKDILELVQTKSATELFELSLYSTEVNSVDDIKRLETKFNATLVNTHSYEDVLTLKHPLYLFEDKLYLDYTELFPQISYSKVIF